MVHGSLVLLLAACTQRAPDRAIDPLDVLIDAVLVPSGLDEATTVVHEVDWLPAGTSLVEAYGDAVFHPKDATLFLVDKTPYARWSHDVDWIWVSDDGALRAETHAFYPIVDGQGFFPPYHPSVWGAPWTVEDPTTAGEDLPIWDAEGARRSAPEAGDPCRPEPRKAAITAELSIVQQLGRSCAGVGRSCSLPDQRCRLRRHREERCGCYCRGRAAKGRPISKRCRPQSCRPSPSSW